MYNSFMVRLSNVYVFIQSSVWLSMTSRPWLHTHVTSATTWSLPPGVFKRRYPTMLNAQKSFRTYPVLYVIWWRSRAVRNLFQAYVDPCNVYPCSGCPCSVHICWSFSLYSCRSYHWFWSVFKLVLINLQNIWWV